MVTKIIIGKEEWCEFPKLGLPAIKARVDSGAKTSSLHAFNIETLHEHGRDYVLFDIHPVQDNRRLTQRCKAPIVDRREVKSSSGEKETRLVIMTPVVIGDLTWEIEITLSNRDSMGYRMLLGREAMVGANLLIDPNSSFCLGVKDSKVVESFYKAQTKKSNALKIALLANNPNLYSNKRIMEAGEDRGHDIRFISIRDCFINITARKPEIHYRGGELLDKFDAIIPRIKPSLMYYGCAITRQFHSLGVFCLNNAESIVRSRDKLHSLQILSQNGIEMPITAFAHSPQDTSQIIKLVGNAPLIVKLLEGTQGMGVVLTETNKAAESVISAFKCLRANILVQEFLKEAEGKDIRMFVINGKVVASMQRESAEGEFRSNLHRGGIATPIKITAAEKRLAIQATKAMGLKVSGVDVVRSKTGPKILEINSSPGLEGIEAATGKDIASMMIGAIEDALKAGKP